MIGNFIIITSFWNESKFMRNFISFTANQNVKPKFWVFIDDGSIDNSADIVKSECDKVGIQYRLYSMPKKKEGNFESIGHAFTAALNHYQNEIDRHEIDFLVKLDVDTRLPSDYLEIMEELMKKYPRVGVISGQIRDEGIREKGPMGTGKAVRWNIAKRIKNYWRGDPDTLWNVKAGEYGFWLLTIDDLLVDTTRPSQGFTRSGAQLLGRQYAYSKRHPIVVLYVGLKMILKRKHGLAFLTAFLKEMLTNREKYDDDYIIYYNSLKFNLIRTIYGTKYLKRVSIKQIWKGNADY
ncbi:MAG: glycosyltransferase [Candidatus Thorarchaeota archaeon]